MAAARRRRVRLGYLPILGMSRRMECSGRARVRRGRGVLIVFAFESHFKLGSKKLTILL
jgi:hypothetical protein